MVQSHSVLCVIRGRPGSVEGLCLDFDIAVHGTSFEEVEATLSQAIRSYVEDVSREDEANQARLLGRRAPLHVRVGLILGFIWHTLLHRGKDDTFSASFRPCPA